MVRVMMPSLLTNLRLKRPQLQAFDLFIRMLPVKTQEGVGIKIRTGARIK